MDDTKITSRQKSILDFLEKHPNFGRSEIQKEIGGYTFTKITLIRELNSLIKAGLVSASGVGRAKVYRPAFEHSLIKFVNLKDYFAKDVDERTGIQRTLNFDIFDELKEILSKEEQTKIDDLNKNYLSTIKKIDKSLYMQELERFIIELSWKSSKIEGNTYTLLETERLIKESIEARGHDRDEAVMILNHKKAFDLILKNKKSFARLDLGDIQNLHRNLVKDLNVEIGFRHYAVGITGTAYKPIDNQWQIKEAMEKTVKLVNQTNNPFEKALITALLIAYIQPFVDGNKRTGRMLANALLLAHDYCPLSYRAVDEIEYKEALILFFETNNLFHFKRLFMDQFEFSVKNYFAA